MRIQFLTLVKGGGDLATGVAYRLFRCGFPVVCTELAQPTVVRRTVAFAEAVYAGEVTVEGVTARRVATYREVRPTLAEGLVPVLVDPQARALRQLRPRVVVDAIMAKRNTGTALSDARFVVGMGPGFEAGVDCHALVETLRGHNLGRVILSGPAAPNTGTPAVRSGFGEERVLRAPAAGIIVPVRRIGDRVEKGEVVARVDGSEVRAGVSGLLRGMIKEGLTVRPGLKVGDVDLGAAPEACYTISDRALAVAGGVLEAIMYLIHRQETV